MNPNELLEQWSRGEPVIDHTSRKLSETYEISYDQFQLDVEMLNGKLLYVDLTGPWSAGYTVKIANSSKDIDALIAALTAAKTLFKD